MGIIAREGRREAKFVPGKKPALYLPIESLHADLQRNIIKISARSFSLGSLAAISLGAGLPSLKALAGEIGAAFAKKGSLTPAKTLLISMGLIVTSAALKTGKKHYAQRKGLKVDLAGRISAHIENAKKNAATRKKLEGTPYALMQIGSIFNNGHITEHNEGSFEKFASASKGRLWVVMDGRKRMLELHVDKPKWSFGKTRMKADGANPSR